MRTGYWRTFVCAFALLVLSIPAPRSALARPAFQGQPVVSGIVQDTAGNPLANARIVIAELNRAAISAGDGSFSFREIRPGTYHLDVSLLGYAPGHQELTIAENARPVRVVVELRITPLSLSGIQVTASITRGDPLSLTQSTLQLSGKDLARNLGSTVAQTLSKQPGIATRFAGPAASLPVIRGLTGERILILQDVNGPVTCPPARRIMRYPSIPCQRSKSRSCGGQPPYSTATTHSAAS